MSSAPQAAGRKTAQTSMSALITPACEDGLRADRAALSFCNTLRHVVLANDCCSQKPTCFLTVVNCDEDVLTPMSTC